MKSRKQEETGVGVCFKGFPAFFMYFLISGFPVEKVRISTGQD
jgi:hypothetical protein